MICTGCQHLDRRNGECQQLNWQVVCGQCGDVYPIALIRCGKCSLRSTDIAGTLSKNEDGEFVADEFCPLTEAQRASLVAKQDAPEPMRQGELF